MLGVPTQKHGIQALRLRKIKKAWPITNSHKMSLFFRASVRD